MLERDLASLECEGQPCNDAKEAERDVLVCRSGLKDIEYGKGVACASSIAICGLEVRADGNTYVLGSTEGGGVGHTDTERWGYDPVLVGA